jgi:alanine-glyoxylate transaminase/serine-glyoxylate transaminase/serine-pyruvate transaminase
MTSRVRLPLLALALAFVGPVFAAAPRVLPAGQLPDDHRLEPLKDLDGYFPFTPATNLLYGLDAAIALLLEEGLDAVFARHTRHAEATRRAVATWGLETQCAEPRHHSSALTAVRLPQSHSADHLRATILANYNMSLGNGLGRLKDQVFRIGHLGDFNDLQLIGTLGGIEMGLANTNIPHQKGGTQSALEYLSTHRK